MVSDSVFSKPIDLPIACTLGGSEGPERLKRWRALSARGVPTVTREADALVVAYPSTPGTREELELLAHAERECCSFAEWDVQPAADHVLLRITAGTEGLAAIAPLFGAT
jgi:hypothetical protein